MISDDVRLGKNVTIVCGVTVGEYALVGAGGAVVTHDVPDYAMITGAPGWVTGDIRDRRKR